MRAAVLAVWLSLVPFLAAYLPYSSAQEINEGKKLYAIYCSGCHGASGKGDGPAAKTLPVKPADHTREVMKNYSDQYLADIISRGGAVFGKSSLMPAWSGVLKEPQISAIVGYIRSLSSEQREAGKERTAPK